MSTTAFLESIKKKNSLVSSLLDYVGEPLVLECLETGDIWSHPTINKEESGICLKFTTPNWQILLEGSELYKHKRALTDQDLDFIWDNFRVEALQDEPWIRAEWYKGEK